MENINEKIYDVYHIMFGWCYLSFYLLKFYISQIREIRKKNTN